MNRLRTLEAIKTDEKGDLSRDDIITMMFGREVPPLMRKIYKQMLFDRIVSLDGEETRQFLDGWNEAVVKPRKKKLVNYLKTHQE